MMRKFLCFLMLWLALSSVGFSQSDTVSLERYVSGRLQVLGVDFSDLNASIAGQYPTLRGEILGLGVGAGNKYGRWSAGFTGMKYIGFESTAVLGQSTRFSGFGVGVNLGVEVWSKDNFLVQFFSETGFRRYCLDLYASDALSIEAVLQEEIEIIQFKNFATYSEFGLGISQFFNVYNTKIGVNLSGGIRLDSGDWKYEGVNTLNQPVSEMNGFFGLFRLIIRSRR